MLPLALGAIAAPVIGGVVGNVLGAGDRAAAQGLSQQALNEILSVKTPDIKSQELSLSPYQIQGLLQAINEEATQVGPSAAEAITTDPRLATAQMQALKKLQDIGAMGITPAEQIEAQQMQRQVDADEASRQKGILQSMAQRGVGGSGVEAAARLASSEAAADRLSNSSDKLRAEAFNRALNATSQAGQLGSNIRSQSFGEQDRIAQAKDAIANFNAQQRSGVNSRNVSAERSRQATNLGAQQSNADRNVELQNNQQRFNKGLIQQNFDNQLRRAGAASGALNTAASGRQASANATGQMFSGIGSGVGSILAAYGAGNKPSAGGPLESTDITNTAKGRYLLNPEEG